jgi:DNA-binding NtrC family response regulator
VQATRKAQLCTDETLPDAHARRMVAKAPEVLAPHIFVALECDRPAAGVARHSLAATDRVVVGRDAMRSSTRSFEDRARTLTIGIPDPCMSSRHACIVRDGVHIAVLDLGSRNGTNVNGARVITSTRLVDGDFVQLGHTILRYRESVSVPVGEPADRDSADDDATSPLATIDPSLARRAAALGRVARTTAPVLVLGETGTGKEVLARALHRLSGRKGPLVAVNCGALPATLVEAQLFGHVRGSFSGAVGEALGLLRSADGGTLLLDEVGDLPEPAQAVLLRALQEHEVVPVGGVRAVKIDLRVVAATHRPIEELIARGEFRSDLFARLAGFTFRLPPLRARREDIGLMIAAYAIERSIRLTPAAGCALLRYDWPLNVRELHQALDVAAALADGAAIDLADLPPAVAQAESPSRGGRRETPSTEWLHQRVLAAFTRHQGNVTEVARELGKGRKQVQRWMKRFGIDARSFRRP